jgi:hypothetical protein
MVYLLKLVEKPIATFRSIFDFLPLAGRVPTSQKKKEVANQLCQEAALPSCANL